MYTMKMPFSKIIARLKVNAFKKTIFVSAIYCVFLQRINSKKWAEGLSRSIYECFKSYLVYVRMDSLK